MLVVSSEMGNSTVFTFDSEMDFKAFPAHLPSLPITVPNLIFFVKYCLSVGKQSDLKWPGKATLGLRMYHGGAVCGSERGTIL